ncbi:MAG: heme biosynthesis HemY N-terminal domain-containing protein [Siculibacillus sp.]
MIRLLVFLAALVGFAVGFSWLADHPGEATFVWLGQRVETDITTVILAAVVGIVVVTIVLLILRAAWNAPGSIGSFFGRRRREKGWAALSRGMIAVGAGDLATAGKASADARHILGDEPLALLLEAQQAQLLGDRGSARRAFEQMLDNPATRLLGLRGLYVEAVRWGDGPAAAQYAEAANRSAPKLAWAGQAMLDHRTRSHDWQGALEIIDKNRRNGVIDKAAAKRARAVILTADGLERETTAADVVRGTSLEAHGLAPELVPAACLAARVSARAGELRKAMRILEATWKLDPHPEIAETYAHLRSGDGAADRLARVRDLVKVRANHPEGALASARAEIDARDFAAARRSLAPFLAQGPTRRVCLLMAEIEEGEGGTAGAVRTWLTRAVHAPRDAAWVADGFVSERWSAVSPVTGRIDAFEWKVPAEDVAAIPFADPIDEADETLALSGALTPMETVRAPATIEKVVPAEAEVIEGTVIEAAASRPIEVPAVEAEPAAPTATGPGTATTVPTQKANGTATDVQPHLPDDPGPDEDAAPKEKKRFRLFS